MAHDLTFETLIDYDTGVPGISINVELRLRDSSITVLAKVDTGSDSCIFSRECGERLGFEIESGEKQIFGTASGSFIAYSHPVTLVTAPFSFDSTVYFAHDEGFDRNVLGRFGWLDRVLVGINDYDGKLYLSR
ncbi:MAG: aspartyl protease family protein [Pyrinomonadaceae bacterium]